MIGPTRDVFPDTPYARAYGRPANARALADAYARPAALRWVSWAAHNSVTREAWEAVGGFDESYSYREDSDLGLRLAEHGLRLVVDPALEIEHRGPATDTATRASRAWVSGASEVLFAERHPQAVVAPEAGRRTVAQHLWSLSTRALAVVIGSRESAARLGGVVERLLARLPAPLFGRAVALVVEASARSGRRHGSTDQMAYRAQKDAELSAERRAQR